MEYRVSAKSASFHVAAGASVRTPAILGGDPRFEHDVFVTRPVMPERDAYYGLLDSVFDRTWLTNNGPLVIELESRLSERLGVAYCASFSSGTSALLTALRALDLRGEVITTPFTFPATPHCIEWNGLRPVFCDVDPETYNLDPALLEACIGEETSAILPVHVFGNPCAIEAIEEIAERHGLRVVYDAAHAFGVGLDGRPIGTFGDLSVLSFHATKVFHSAEGGAIVAATDVLREKVSLLRNFGIVNENEVRGVGINGKLSELHAAMGILTLDLVEREIERRGELAARYLERLQDVEGLHFQRIRPGTTRNHFNFTVEVDEEAFGLSRDEVHAGLCAERIIARKYFHPLCSENECYADLPSAHRELLPNAHRLSSRILSLPLHGQLGADEVDAVADALLALRDHAPLVRRAARNADA